MGEAQHVMSLHQCHPRKASLSLAGLPENSSSLQCLMRSIVLLWLFASASYAAPTKHAVAVGSDPSRCTQFGCWFSLLLSNGSSSRCGQVNAVQRMPKEIWSDQAAVDAYVAATIELYTVFGKGNVLTQGKCPTTWQLVDKDLVNWTQPRLMEVVCSLRCHCHYPDCKDEPDDPRDHHYCSLCGPRFNSPIVIEIFNPPPPPATKNIVELAAGTPDLSTLVTAINAGNLTRALSNPGPFTVFAPTNQAFADLPPGLLKKLLEPGNIKQLDAILKYHVVPSINGNVIRTGDLLPPLNDYHKTLLEGNILTISAFRTFNAGESTVVTRINGVSNISIPDIDATNGVVHLIDRVLIPRHLLADDSW